MQKSPIILGYALNFIKLDSGGVIKSVLFEILC